MIDASVLVNPVNAGNAGLQQLPMPQAQDVKRFEDILTQPAIGVSSTQDVQAPILSIITPMGESSGGFKQAIFEKIQGMDNSYHNVLSDYQDMSANWRDNVKIGSSKNDADEMRSYPEIQDSKSSSGQIQRMAQDAADSMHASAEQQNQILRWGVKMEMWSSHMKIIAAAVGQVSQGFKTLFQAG
jgi:hypothetical protein